MLLRTCENGNKRELYVLINMKQSLLGEFFNDFLVRYSKLDVPSVVLDLLYSWSTEP